MDRTVKKHEVINLEKLGHQIFKYMDTLVIFCGSLFTWDYMYSYYLCSTTTTVYYRTHYWHHHHHHRH